jgi:hypothetical protein
MLRNRPHQGEVQYTLQKDLPAPSPQKQVGPRTLQYRRDPRHPAVPSRRGEKKKKKKKRAFFVSFSATHVLGEMSRLIFVLIGGVCPGGTVH